MNMYNILLKKDKILLIPNLSVILGILLIVFHSCEADMPDPPKKDNKIILENTTIQDSSYRTATVMTSITIHENQETIKYGHCWSINKNPSTSLNTKSEYNYYNPDNQYNGFIDTIAGLAPNTKYYIRAYVQYGSITIYSQQEDFSTYALKVPEVNTIASSVVSTINSITLSGEVTDIGGSPIVERGICYNIANDTTKVYVADINNDGNIGSFTLTINLTGGILYTLRAYATNSVNTSYGNELNVAPGEIPIADFYAADPYVGFGANTIQFTDLSTNNPTSWFWEFGDGETSTLQNPAHTYSNRNSVSYSVSLTVSNALGSHSETKTNYITAKIKDYDNNAYDIVKIGYQWWMAQNLKTTRYNNGTTIPLVTDNYTWHYLTTPGYCWFYNDKEMYENPYGALYNCYAVKTGNLCPNGWHVPTHSEWTTLIKTLGGESVAGGKLKETGFAHWADPNTGASNSSGFTAVGSGFRWVISYDYPFVLLNWHCYFWTATETDGNRNYSILLLHDQSTAETWNSSWESGFSVRCVRD